MRVLHRLDLNSGAREQIGSLPADFVPLDYRISFDERMWYVFGVPVQQNLSTLNGYVLGEFAAGDAQLLIFDLERPEEIETVELVDVLSGSVPVDSREPDAYPIDVVTPGLDWSADGTRLYVGLADSPEGVVVDLEAGEVLDRYTLDEGASWLERFGAWLVPSASAAARGVMNGFALDLEDRKAVAFANAYEILSSDRQELQTAAHYPVWLMDLETGRQLWQSHVLGIVALARIPGSDHLIVHTASDVYFVDDRDENNEHALRILDISSGDILNTFELPGRPLRGRESMVLSRQYAYVAVITDNGSEVIVVDLDSLSEVGGWTAEEGEPGIGQLLPLP
ncbi:MAG: hypothetical protein R2849_09320 [Thermomicrobiales bacterium]